VPTFDLEFMGLPLQAVVPAQSEGEATTEESKPPSPIAPELKELVWGAGAFIVLALAVRLFLFPKIKKGMDARHELIRNDLETADRTRAAAEAELAEYNAELAKVRAEANGRIDAARQTMDAERHAKLAEVNLQIGEKRAAAAVAAEEARTGARDAVAASAAQVSRLAAQRVLGRDIDPESARAAVEAAMSAGVR
jgi:F-type H+-transporting ATPase subunit b